MHFERNHLDDEHVDNTDIGDILVLEELLLQLLAALGLRLGDVVVHDCKKMRVLGPSGKWQSLHNKPMYGIWRYQALYRLSTRFFASLLSVDNTGLTCCIARCTACRVAMVFC